MNQPHISYQLQKRSICFQHNMKTSQNDIVLPCYRNAVRNANTPIGHNIAFLRNTLGIDINNNEIKPDISLPGPKVRFTLSSYDIECLITNTATL